MAGKVVDVLLVGIDDDLQLGDPARRGPELAQLVRTSLGLADGVEGLAEVVGQRFRGRGRTVGVGGQVGDVSLQADQAVARTVHIATIMSILRRK